MYSLLELAVFDQRVNFLCRMLHHTEDLCFIQALFTAFPAIPRRKYGGVIIADRRVGGDGQQMLPVVFQAEVILRGVVLFKQAGIQK